jgi:flavin reductase (DIM6/NTAB) family NADH-FMN oxidoreductase RutF
VVNKFSEAGLTPFSSKKISASLITECFMNIECKVIDQFDTGDHTVFIAKPLAAYSDEDVLINGRISDKYHDKKNQVQIGDLITKWNMW